MPTRKYDLKKAEWLLRSEAGWKKGKDSDVRQKDGKNLEMAMYYDKGSSSQKEQAEYLQAEFRENGY